MIASTVRSIEKLDSGLEISWLLNGRKEKREMRGREKGSKNKVKERTDKDSCSGIDPF